MHQETDIDTFLKLAGEIPVIDVRTPAEFKQGRIPVAHNIPLFSDAERKSVGIAYKTKGRQHAILKGMDYARPKMKSYVEKALKTSPNQNLLIHCWRGGMRSASMAWLFEISGLHCHVLKGGYKSFRNKVLACLNETYPFLVIGGLTGSGKTGILRSLAGKSEQILDLEGLAHHKGSAFGHIGEKAQSTNEQFENDIFWTLNQLESGRIIWVEDESRGIGKNTIPGGIFERMRQAPLIFLDVPLKIRIQRLVKDYTGCPDELLLSSIEKISKKLGGQITREAIRSIHIKNYAKTAELLLRYYDKTYLFSLGKRDPDKVFRIRIEDLFSYEASAEQILQFVKQNIHTWNLFN